MSELKAACDDILADLSLQPVKDSAGRILETHCNIGAERVARRLGCGELTGPDGKALMADQQYDVMDDNESGRWTKVCGEAATAHAMGHPAGVGADGAVGNCPDGCPGGLAFACASSEMLHEQHGHIAAIYPADMEFSGSLGKEVPIVANIGREDHEEKESAAFPVADGEPDYFTYS